jgi:hypothetical protein
MGMRLRLALLSFLAALTAASCGSDPGAPAITSPPGPGVAGVVTAGPACPVAQDPPDPACADRPVVGAVLEVRRPDGTLVAAAQSDGTGRFAASLPPGEYLLVPQPVEGLLGTAAPQDFVVEGQAVTTLMVSYDTGIRGPEGG